MTKEEFKYIEDYYFNKMTKGVITPDAINKCYRLITGTDMALRGMQQKKLTITRWIMSAYHELKRGFDAKDAAQKAMLTKMKDSTETNFSGRKVEPHDDMGSMSLNNEGQSHQEDCGCPEAHDDLGTAKPKTNGRKRNSKDNTGKVRRTRNASKHE